MSGTATYIDDIPELAGTLHAALGLSPVAHGVLKSVDLAPLRALPGVVDVITAADIPGPNDCGPIVHDDPVLAAGHVHYVGPARLCRDREHARRRAPRRRAGRARARHRAAAGRALRARGACAAAVRAAADADRAQATRRAAIDAAPHRLAGQLTVGGQEHFYLEGQVSYAVPLEDGTMRVHCSTQHPSEMQHVVAKVLKLRSHDVLVECRRMGGGFGGKESQSALFACVAAVAARRLDRPVKLRLDRDDDFLATGRRHGFEYDYEAGFDDDGRLLGVDLVLISNAGFSADLSGPVMTRALCHVDNAYWLPHVRLQGCSARTNTQSNTAFRGFGGPQGAIAIEFILDSVARHLGRDPLDVRRANFYGTGERNVTPYRQVVDDNVIDALVAELARDAHYAPRRAAAAAFNAASPVLKKGLALTPVKFGISFNLTHFNQAGALVHVYHDGSILVNHGGTEMGQGLNTKVAQVVARELGVKLERVRCTATDTSKVANTSATAASTGSDLNGKAAQDAARQIRERLAAMVAKAHGADAADVRFEHDEVLVGHRRIEFGAVVMQAYLERVQLWSDGHYATPGLHWDRETMTGRPFYYFAYGAAVSEVVVDTLTGEWRLLRADLLHDVGRSLNTAIDIGQIEGGFVQGMGWLTSEELVWHAKTGALMTHAPSTYKIPTANDVPSDFRVRLFDNANVHDSIHRSKAVGEPPLLLAFSVWLAIRDAVAAVTGGAPRLDAPATPEAILRALGRVWGRGHDDRRAADRLQPGSPPASPPCSSR